MGLLARAGNYIAEKTGYGKLKPRELNVDEDIDHEPQGTFGWTLKRVQWALEAVERGDMGPGHEIWLAMTRHPKIKHGLKLRRDTLTQVPFYFEKPEGLDQAFFDEWVAQWPRCWSRPAQGLANGYKIGLGLAPLNVTWAMSDDASAWRPTVHVKEPLCVDWHEERRIYRFQARVGALGQDGLPLPVKAEAAGTAGQVPMWPLDGTRWLMLQEEPLRPHHHGALRSLAAAWYMSTESARWHSAHNRKHGMEWLGVKMPASEREGKDAKDLLEACIKLENAGVIPLPQAKSKDEPSWGLEVFSAKTEASRTFTSLVDISDSYITLLLLGAEENTQGGAGNNAKAKTQDRVALRLTKGDCAGIIEVHDQLARTACEANDLDPDLAPRLLATVEVPEDASLKAEVNEKNANAGAAAAAIVEKLDAANAARVVAKQPLIEYEVDYLFEQCGLMLTRAQDGQQTAPR